MALPAPRNSAAPSTHRSTLKVKHPIHPSVGFPHQSFPLTQRFLGHNTYMGYQFFPFSQSQGYDPTTCAQACTVQTAYNSRHPAADGSYQTCTFFNAYVLSQNSIPQGLYCSLYSQAWDPKYATNYGQYRGSDRYTVSESYSYTLVQ